jgi:hypothetical protein
MAQDNSQPPPQAQTAPPDQQAAQAPLDTPAQLDQMLAPIALYPDQLLGQILMASTYPLEVVQADRWVKDPNNAALKGDQLAAALAPIDWDPSVKSLVPFPQILALMDQRVDWTQNLGNAFLAQQADVMDSVQRLRHQAQAAGTLQTTAQQTVVPDGQTITIQPASPTVVYVPVYNPATVYGAWPYPAYPPFYFPPPPGFYVGPPLVSGIGFSIGFGIVGAFWGWDSWDWGHRRLHIDANRYNVINNYFIRNDRRPAFSGNNWAHDPVHRRGVVYADPRSRAAFRGAPAAGAAARRDFRGFDRGAPAQQVNRTPAAAGRPAGARPTPPSAQRPAPAGQRPAASVQRPAAAPPQQQGQRPSAAPPRQQQVQPQRPVAAAPRAPAPAFQGFARGADVRAQAARGQASERAAAPRAAAPRAAAPAAAAPRAAAPRAAAPRGGAQPNEKERR